MKTGAIKNCEIKPKDFENAISIWSKNVAELKGKTVQKKPAPIVSVIMKVPRDLLKFEKDISLALDIFFVNGFPFLITLSLRIYFTTVSNLKNQKLKTVIEILKHIYVYYFQQGFRITEFLLDPQFEAMAPLICDKIGAPRINVTAASEHITPVERRIKVVKERCRATRHSLPFPRITSFMMTRTFGRFSRTVKRGTRSIQQSRNSCESRNWAGIEQGLGRNWAGIGQFLPFFSIPAFYFNSCFHAFLNSDNLIF